MAEFKEIKTQEEFDAAIKERLERERDKFKDYETLKETIESQKGQIDELNEQITGINSQIEEKDNTISELNSKVKKYESDSVKTRIAREHGIPTELAGRLQGDSEEELKKDAEALAKIVKTKKAPPLKSGEGNGEDEKNTAYKNMLGKLFND